MMLAPDGKVQVASANGRFFKNFEHFMFHCATALLNQMRPPYGNSFFVHWRIDNPASVWADYENISVYPRRLLEAIRDQGLQPRATKRLYPLLYGIQRGCDAGQIPDLYDSSDYQERVRLYEGSNAEERPLSYRGIETDAGVLLFNSTARGEALYGEYLHFLAGSFLRSAPGSYLCSHAGTAARRDAPVKDQPTCEPARGRANGGVLPPSFRVLCRTGSARDLHRAAVL